MSATYLYINDPLANTWQVGIADNGVVTTTQVAHQSVAPLIVNDSDTNTTSWEFTIDVNGFFNTTEVTFSTSYPTYVFLNSPSVDNVAFGVFFGGLWYSITGKIPPSGGFPHIDSINFGLALDAGRILTGNALASDQINFGLALNTGSIFTSY